MDEYQLSNNRMLHVSPEEIIFHKDAEGIEKKSFCIENIFDSPIIYKIKSTNLRAFRLEPHSGMLDEEQTVQINVNFDPSEPYEANEKFLVITAAIDREQSNYKSVRKMFKQAESTTRQYVSCKVLSEDDENESGLEENKEDIEEKIKTIEKRLSIAVWLQSITLVLVSLIYVVVNPLYKRN